jgi:hypothetical protein
VWLSPGSIVGGERIGRFAIFGATVLLALAPLAILRNAARAEYGRSVAYFGVAWVVLAAIPLLGYSSQRHLFLASAGMAVALGLAGAALLQAQGLPRLAGATLIAGLLTIQAIALTSHLRVFDENGALSQQLRDAITMALDGGALANDEVLVIIAELPDRRKFWHCSLPFAMYPPFTQADPRGLIPSLRSSCSPDNWAEIYGPALARATSGQAARIHVVAWDEDHGGFTARVMNADAFRAAGYIAPEGPLRPPSQADELRVSHATP